MTGSVIDGEDVLQDALIKAAESLASAGEIGNSRGWLFRIAQNGPKERPSGAIRQLSRKCSHESRRLMAAAERDVRPPLGGD
jgi:DNA-directed RNA polymerase specialized sigma24 family protein